MKALTVWQPWASLIIAGLKPYEFRGWRVPRSLIGQRIVIHAAARAPKRGEIASLFGALFHGGQGAAETCLHPPAIVLLKEWSLGQRELVLSAGLGTAVLGEPRNGIEIAEEFGVPRANDSDRDEHANWGWPMLDVEPWAEPVPMKGAQGFWSWPTPEAAGL